MASRCQTAAVRIGIHLPQYGRAAGAESIKRAAQHAEALGFADVWVSDHLAVPVGAPYPPAFLFEPMVALTWAAAATSTIGLGTSVLVLPYRHPLHLAKELASLEQLAGPRLTIGVAAGWLEGEFDALGIPFAERGRRTDEAIDVLRACFGPDPVTYEGSIFHLRDMQVKPKPSAPIPLWVGGHSPAAIGRAVRVGDGWHGTFLEPEATATLVARIRAERDDPTFPLSMRTTWDGLATPHDDIRRMAAAFAEMGIGHLMVSPIQANLDDWLRSTEALWDVLGVR
jgi:probable F420-dependent oxidoreductase